MLFVSFVVKGVLLWVLQILLQTTLRQNDKIVNIFAFLVQKLIWKLVIEKNVGYLTTVKPFIFHIQV